MSERPTLYVCHADEGGPPGHPCARVQKTMRAKGIEFDKVIGGHGSPFPFLRKGREELERRPGVGSSRPWSSPTEPC